MENENNGTSIVRLQGAGNWDIWKFQVKLVLQEKDLMGVVTNGTGACDGDGGKDKKEASPEITKKDFTAQKIIGTSMSPSAAVHLLSCSSAQGMWMKLHEVYELKNEMSAMAMNEQFLAAKKEKDEIMSTYISRVEEMARKLKVLKNPVSSGMLLTKILRGLPDNYRHFVTCWESAAASDRNLANLRARLMIEEERLGLLPSNDCGSALAARKNTRADKKVALQPKKNEERNFKCFKCGKKGHMRRDCQSKEEHASALVCSSGFDGDSAEFVADSGASDHMCHDREVFESLTDCTRRIKIANGALMTARGKGTVKVRCFDGQKWIDRDMLNVLYVPEIKYNLFSITTALDRGYEWHSTAKVCKVLDGNGTVAMGTRKDKWFIMQIVFATARAMVASKERLPISEWHKRLVHQNVAHVKKVLRQHDIDYKNEKFQCEACIFGKMTRASFPTSGTVTERCGDIIHADLCGPMPTRSLGGASYYLLLKDDYSHYRTIYFLAKKETVSDKICEFLDLVKTQVGHTVKALRTDNGLEFVNNRVDALLRSGGTLHQTAVTYTPEQNGSVERDNRTIMEAARTMLFARELNPNLWAEAANTVVYVLNRTGTSSVENRSPIELWTGKSADLSNLNAFGRSVYCQVPSQLRKKLNAKAVKCIFVGYSETSKGYRVFNPESNKVETAISVVFECPSARLLRINDDDDQESEEEDDLFFETEASDLSKSTVVSDLDGSLCGLTEGNIIPYRLRRRGGEVSDGTALLATGEPCSYSAAINSNQREFWKSAMEEEYKSLIANGTWVLVNSSNQKLVDNRWVFKIKYDVDGKVDRHKARLVARGFTQIYGVDYWETFSPVVRMESVRLIFAIAASRNLRIQQFDIKTAFLNGDLEEEIYMRQPEGFDDGSGRVCKLKKSLYGLKQASRCWNVAFVNCLLEFGLRQCKSDPCVFIGSGDGMLILGIYVDDGILAAESEKDVSQLMAKLTGRFEMSACKFGLFLGMEVKRLDSGDIQISQRSYSEKVLERFGMSEAHPVGTPTIGADGPVVAAEEVIKFPYRAAVGSLLYLAVVSRPDLSFAVGMASRHMENPTREDVCAVKRVLRYLKGTSNLRIQFSSGAALQLVGYCDADYAGDKESRRSTSGCVFMVGGAAISWRSERQSVVATSTTEAEYIAAAEAVKEMIWLKRFLEEMTGSCIKPLLRMDNQSAMKLIDNPVMHRRTKHIDVRYHFVRDEKQKKTFSLEFVRTNEQLADFLTKGLSKEKLIINRKAIQLFE